MTVPPSPVSRENDDGAPRYVCMCGEYHHAELLSLRTAVSERDQTIEALKTEIEKYRERIAEQDLF